MSRLQTTFETLKHSTIDSAVDVLILALEDPDAEIRQFGLQAMVTAEDPRLAAKLLEYWESLTASDIATVRQNKQNFADLIEKQIQVGDQSSMIAIDAAEQLGLTTSLMSLITLAESSGSHQIKRRAGEAVVRLARPLGQRARKNRDRSTVRGPILARLVDSVQCFPMHRSELLIDAFLEISAWPDGDLRQLLDQPSPARDLICAQLKKTSEPGAIELLAGFVRRREIPHCIAKVIQIRADETFRDALLEAIGDESSTILSKNIELIGMPRCCNGGERLVNELQVGQLAALIHVYVASNNDSIEKLQVVAAAAERGADQCMAAAALGFARCETPSTDFWMRAAIPVADANEAAIAGDENARLLYRLISMLEHTDGALVRSVRQVLLPLHVDNIIDRLEPLRPRSRKRLGKVVLMIDIDAITRVHDALRHPVLSHRLNAIAMAQTLGCVDQLSESLAHVVREDHQDARILAAEVMGEATNEATMGLLEEMTRLPDCGVRDAALSALEKRQASSQ